MPQITLRTATVRPFRVVKQRHGDLSLTRITSVTGLALVIVACNNQQAETSKGAAVAAVATAPTVAAAVAVAAAPKPAVKEISERVLRRFTPVRARIEGEQQPAMEERVALGRMLFHETRLSMSQAVLGTLISVVTLWLFWALRRRATPWYEQRRVVEHGEGTLAMSVQREEAEESAAVRREVI